MTRSYIIPQEPDDLHSFRLFRADTLIHFHRNGGTASLSISDARHLAHGLLALLSGEFDEALTETALRIRNEEALRRQHIAAQPQPSPSPTALRAPAPDLGDL